MTGKSSGKLARQLLFSEDLQIARPASRPAGPHPPAQSLIMTNPVRITTMERILQEITAVSRRLEGMDTPITSLATETKSMRLDVAGFLSRVTGLEHRMTTMGDHIHTVQDRVQDLLYLRSRLTDLEDRSHRDNVCFFRFPLHAEGSDTPSFLRAVLPKLTDLTFNPSLEFQGVHRLGPKQQNGTSRPSPIIACVMSRPIKSSQRPRRMDPSRWKDMKSV
ncbi:hypothetical protein NDU88_006318 [Pleurodeles waltl]|uniref:Uncharacterized protein n=1 Tax=Pleurodeles waltl TaxID=8319 RepID=A0AAV7N3P9_PLEWA|nr:hypothetical protein NDU88_006318 [Pleurodeles waltl]